MAETVTIPDWVLGGPPTNDTDYVFITIEVDPVWWSTVDSTVQTAFYNRDSWAGVGWTGGGTQAGWTNKKAITVIGYNAGEGHSEQSDVNYSNPDVPGRFEKLFVYDRMGNRQIKLKLQWAATKANVAGDYAESPDPEKFTPLWIQGEVRFLDSLKMPFANGPLTCPPPPLILRIGHALVARVLLTAGSIQWSDGIVPHYMTPMCATYDATFTVTRRFYVGNTDPYASTYSGIPVFNRFLSFRGA